MRNIFAVMTSSTAFTSFLDANRPRSETYSTLLSHPRTYVYFVFRSSLTRTSFSARAFLKSSLLLPHSTALKGDRVASWRAVPTAMRFLLGTQPTLTHVPPIVAPLVAFPPTIAVLTPSSSALIAAANAADPCPRMTRSKLLVSVHRSKVSQPRRLLAYFFTCSLAMSSIGMTVALFRE